MIREREYKRDNRRMTTVEIVKVEGARRLGHWDTRAQSSRESRGPGSNAFPKGSNGFRQSASLYVCMCAGLQVSGCGAREPSHRRPTAAGASDASVRCDGARCQMEFLTPTAAAEEETRRKGVHAATAGVIHNRGDCWEGGPFSHVHTQTEQTCTQTRSQTWRQGKHVRFIT